MKLFKLSLIFVFTFIIISCNNNDQDINQPAVSKGGVSLTLLKSSIPPEIKVILVKMERSGFPSIIDSVVLTTSMDTVKFSFTNIPLGTWNLTVLAKDINNIVKYIGSASVNVLEGQTTKVYVLMTPVGSGLGNVDVYVYWGPITSNWRMYINNPIIKQTIGGFDSDHYYITDPWIIKVGNEYKMWYTTGTSNLQWIAYATSIDGINWTKRGIVINQGAPGSWYESGVSDPTVLFESGVYKMWFCGKTSTNVHFAIGYATSTDGINWTVNPTPVILASFQKPGLFGPCILKKDNEYYLYYTVEYSIYNREIWLAKSLDGINWQDQGLMIKMREGIHWEEDGVFDPMVFYDEGKFKMYYSSMSDTRIRKITLYVGYCESTDGKIWTNRGNTPELQASQTNPWQTLSAAYPFIIRDAGKLKMWFSGLSVSPNVWQIGYAEQ